MRRTAGGLAGRLTIYAAVDAENTLLHSKLIITDGERMSIGSANLTGKGFVRISKPERCWGRLRREMLPGSWQRFWHATS
ncbi:phospholipase D-like domain-containing protein [Burkholderia pseudomallei]|uniref:phospholipase D-like domain-containing protein n=1 Tax=Burkholderia pseudomallei TaxID=28450 RepID=UPI0011602CA7